MEWARVRAHGDDSGIAVPSAKEEDQVRGGKEGWSREPSRCIHSFPLLLPCFQAYPLCGSSSDLPPNTYARGEPEVGPVIFTLRYQIDAPLKGFELDPSVP